MANILDVFNNNLCNSEVGFIISGLYMRSILDCSDTIMEYYKNREPDIADLDGYIDYLFLIKAIGLKGEAEYALSNDDKAKYAILVDDLNEISAKYKRGDELKYINSNISIIISEYPRFRCLINATLDLCVNYPTGIKDETFMFLAENSPIVLLSRYEDLQKRLEKNTVIIKTLFESILSDKECQHYLRPVLDILKSIEKRKHLIFEKLDDVIEKLADLAISIAKSANIETVLYDEKNFTEIHKFLKQIKSARANDLNNYVKKINELLDEYEKAHSTVLTYRVPTEEIERMLSRNDSWIIKLLQITHKHLNNGDALTSNLDFPPQKHITDIFYTNVPTNEYFTLSHQNQLDYILIIGGAALFFVLKDKRYFDECMLQIGELIDNIYVASNCSTKGIENDYRTLVQMLDNAFHSTITGNDNGEMIRSLCYGTEMYICAFTERILRSVYVSLIQKERYVQESKLTFGALLSSENNPLKIIFGESLLRHFNYFFCVDNEGYNVGCNLRNRLAHLTEDSNELLSYEYVSKLLYLLVSIINSLYLYFCFNKPFKEGK